MNWTIGTVLRSTAAKVLMAASIAAPAIPLATPAWAAGTHRDDHGHEKSDDHHGGDDHHGMKIGEPADASQADRTVAVEMGEMYFKPDRLSIDRGEVIRFVVTNAGEFVHEFNLGTAGMHRAHADEMMEMMDSGVLEPHRINRHMMEEGGMHHDDPNSLLLEPGESGEVTWRFSEEIELELSCNVPGHRESGMLGHIHMSH